MLNILCFWAPVTDPGRTKGKSEVMPSAEIVFPTQDEAPGLINTGLWIAQPSKKVPQSGVGKGC